MSHILVPVESFSRCWNDFVSETMLENGSNILPVFLLPKDYAGFGRYLLFQKNKKSHIIKD